VVSALKRAEPTLWKLRAALQCRMTAFFFFLFSFEKRLAIFSQAAPLLKKRGYAPSQKEQATPYKHIPKVYWMVVRVLLMFRFKDEAAESCTVDGESPVVKVSLEHFFTCGN
jgi:hypothetical protein